MNMELEIKNNPSHQRFEAWMDNELGYIEYRWRDNHLYIMHTFIPEAFRGKGVGNKLAHFALEYIKANKISTTVYCPFVRGYLEKHPEYEGIAKLG